MLIFTVMKQFETLRQIYDHSTSAFAGRQMNRWTDGTGGYTYAEFKEACDKLSDLLSSFGVGTGDKVALLAGSTPNWTAAFFATTAFGRVIVPLLTDFSENEVTNVLTHSEAKALFVSERLFGKINEDCLKNLHVIIDITNFEVMYIDGVKVEGHATGKESAACSVPERGDLAALIYTSGTTGKAKGVMLSHLNFAQNIWESYNFYPVSSNDVFLSILPLAHTYELSVGLIYPFSGGACVCYMTKKPTPSALKEVMPAVRPTIMLTVPLIMEKVYKGVVLPKVKKSKTLSWMNRHASRLFSRMASKEIIRYFGGRLKFFGVGGAKLDPSVEEFMIKGRFPYYIGYGLTECAPLVSGCNFKNTRPGSIGWPFKDVEMKLINVNPDTGEGEIVVKGNNVMMGYYKDPERTAEAFTEDGWFRTNDLGVKDKKGRYFIKGRLNNMIVGSSGENIYPEEIENVIKNEDGVAEAIVIQRNKTLIALIELSDGVVNDISKFKEKILHSVNSKVSQASKVSEVQIMKEPFIKTATQKIRRFLYKDSAPTIEESEKDKK